MVREFSTWGSELKLKLLDIAWAMTLKENYTDGAEQRAAFDANLTKLLELVDGPSNVGVA